MAWDREERLRQLRRVVEDAPDYRFRMSDFTSPWGECGTAHCAAGWAAIDPWFQEHTGILEHFDVLRGDEPESFVAACKSHDVFLGMAEMFDISRDDSTGLFGGELSFDDDVPKSEVLANIDRLLAGLPAEPY